MDDKEGKKPAIIVQATAVEVKPVTAPQIKVDADLQEGEEPTALKDQKEKPSSNLDILDADIFDDLEASQEDNEIVEASTLLDDDDAVEGAEDGDMQISTSEETEEENIGVMTIYQVKCLRCTHLIPELNDETNPKGKEFKSCHYENGNEECPAQYATIVIGIPVEKIVKSILESESSGDTEKLSAIYAKLAGKDEAQQSEVHRRLAIARKNVEVEA